MNKDPIRGAALIMNTHSRCLISALKLASAAWWIPFFVMSSSFSSAMVRSLRLSFPSRLKFRACKKKKQFDFGDIFDTAHLSPISQSNIGLIFLPVDLMS